MLGADPALLDTGGTIAESIAKLESEGREGPLKKGRMRLMERSPFGDKADIGEDKAIRNVTIIGITSKNNRIYPREVLEKAAAKFEGAQVFIDHRDPDSTMPNSIRNLAGTVSGIYFDANKNALMARELKPCGPAAGILQDCANTAPKHCGLSVDVEGEGEKAANGWLRVTNIENVNSVDLVSRPASTRNLFESVIEPITEGDVSDKVSADEEQTKLNRIWSATSDLIQRVMWGYDNANMTRGKKVARISELATEFLALIKPMASAQESQQGDGARGPGDRQADSPPNMQENSEMDLSKLTVATLTESRADLVKSIQESAVAPEKKRADDAEAKVKELEGKLNAISAKEAAMKLATEACDEKKLPAAARTPLFLESLVRAGDKPAMLALVEDRMVGFAVPRPSMDNPEKHAAGGGGEGGAGGVSQDEVNKLLGV